MLVLGRHLFRVDIQSQSPLLTEYLALLKDVGGLEMSFDDVQGATEDGVFTRLTDRGEEYTHITFHAMVQLARGTRLEVILDSFWSFIFANEVKERRCVDCEVCDEEVPINNGPGVEAHLQGHSEDDVECALVCIECNILILTTEVALGHIDCVQSFSDAQPSYAYTLTTLNDFDWRAQFVSSIDPERFYYVRIEGNSRRIAATDLLELAHCITFSTRNKANHQGRVNTYEQIYSLFKINLEKGTTSPQKFPDQLLSPDEAQAFARQLQLQNSQIAPLFETARLVERDAIPMWMTCAGCWNPIPRNDRYTWHATSCIGRTQRDLKKLTMFTITECIAHDIVFYTEEEREEHMKHHC